MDNYCNEPIIEELYIDYYDYEPYFINVCKNCPYKDEDLIKPYCPKCGNPLFKEYDNE